MAFEKAQGKGYVLVLLEHCISINYKYFSYKIRSSIICKAFKYTLGPNKSETELILTLSVL